MEAVPSMTIFVRPTMSNSTCGLFYRRCLSSLNSWAVVFALMICIDGNVVNAQEDVRLLEIAEKLLTTSGDRERVDSAILLLNAHVTSPDTLKCLKKDPSVALLCQWHDLFDTLVRSGADQKTAAEMPKRLATEFAPIVKATLGVDAPPEWLELISTSKLERRELYFDVRAYQTTCSVFDGTKILPRVELSDVDVSEASFHVEIEGGGGEAGIDALFVPSPDVKEGIRRLERYAGRWYTGAANETQAIVLIQADKYEWQQNVFCLTRVANSNNSKTSWKAQLNSAWGGWVFPKHVGARIGVSQIRLTKSHVSFLQDSIGQFQLLD